MMTKKIVTNPIELTIFANYHILTLLVIDNNILMDLSHQVNTIATINIFCMSNINFDITYYLLHIKFASITLHVL